jgi:uncharacterized protein YecE (DUF72 family)
MAADEFLSRLDDFLGALPKDFRDSVEVRDAGLLGERYGRILEKHGVAHVTIGASCRGLAEQHKRMQQFAAPFTVLRLLTPLGMTYEAAKKRAIPYDKIVGELPEMRAQTVELVQEAVSRKIRAYVLVNNRTMATRPSRYKPLSMPYEKRALGKCVSLNAMQTISRFPSLSGSVTRESPWLYPRGVDTAYERGPQLVRGTNIQAGNL